MDLAHLSPFPSDAGKIVKNVIRSRPDGLIQHFVRNAQGQGPDSIAQLHSLIAEQGQYLDRLRASIARIGQSLAEIDGETEMADAGRRQMLLLKAQAEAIQGLTLLAIKGQHLQAETVRTVEILAGEPAPPQGVSPWIYCLIGLSIVGSLVGLLL
jgi:hypothetical protein